VSRTHIVIHHSATADSGTVSWDDIERYHVVEKAWDDIGYHYGCELVASGGYVALVGRDERRDAAACREAGMNRLGIHVCCVGDYDKIPPEDAMLRVLVRRLLRPLMARHGIPPDRIIGHRDAGLMAGFDWHKGQYKSCPGKLFDLERVRRMVR
jgi:hypothetical protein